MRSPAVGSSRRGERVRARRVSESRSPAALWRAELEPDRDDPLLLDTHAWLWTLDGSPGSMSVAAIELIERAANSGRLYVSDISFWEVSLKAAAGKLLLSIAPTLWLTRAAQAPGIRTLPVTRDVLIQSTLLAGTPHADPADRMLIAQAQLGGLSLLTCDGGIVEYAGVQRGVPVCDARAKRGRARR